MRTLALPLITLALIVLAVGSANGQFAAESTTLTVFRDGLVRVTQVLVVNQSVPAIKLSLLSPSVGNVLVLDQANLPLSYEISRGNITIFTVGASQVTLEYDTTDLTRKEGGVWTLILNTSYDTTVVLPRDSIVTYVSELPAATSSRDRQPTLVLTPGIWEISYAVPIQVPATTATTIPPSPLATTPLLVGIGSAVVIAAAVGLILLRRRRTATLEPSENVEPRPDDKQVLQFLSERGGRAMETEIRSKFLLPKTTAWRQIKRLERMGFVRIRRVGSQNEIELIKETG